MPELQAIQDERLWSDASETLPTVGSSSLFIEYCEGGKSSKSGHNTRPSVRVKVRPSSKSGMTNLNYAVKITKAPRDDCLYCEEDIAGWYLGITPKPSRKREGDSQVTNPVSGGRGGGSQVTNPFSGRRGWFW